MSFKNVKKNVIDLNEVHLVKKWFQLFWITYSKNAGEYIYLPLKVIRGFRNENLFLQNSCDNKLNIRPAYIMFKYSKKAANLQKITHFKFDGPKISGASQYACVNFVCDQVGDFLKISLSSKNKWTLLMLFSTISIK